MHQQFGFYSFRYPVLADWHFIKRAMSSAHVRIKGADFVAGEFSLSGLSNNNRVRALSELWLVQRETGESPILQYLLFQLRLLYRLRSAIS
jgi:hypothetical protein